VYKILLAAKLTSVSGFLFLSVQRGSVWALCATADALVALSIWWARRGVPQTVRAHAGLARRYVGIAPFYETWFGQIDLGPDRAFWFRYTLLDGVTRETAVWAVLFDRGRLRAGKVTWPIERLTPAGVQVLPPGADPARFREQAHVFHVADAHLDDGNAFGRAGDLSWELRLDDRGRRFRHVPRALRLLRLARSELDTAMADARFSGTIHVDGEALDVKTARGLVGHVHGTRFAHSWVWTHCTTFDNEESAVFEGLTARVRLGRRVSRPLSSFFLALDGREYRFSSTRRLFSASTAIHEGRFQFHTTANGVSLEGQVTTGGADREAVLTYTDTDGSPLWCTSGRLCTLRLRLVDTRRGMERVLIATHTAALELADRTPPRRTPTL
jgi:hypothetical protein